MHKTRYRLKTPTIAILTADERKIPVTVPQGAMVEVDVELDEDRLVYVRWEGKTVMMFTMDLRVRGELIYASRGA